MIIISHRGNIDGREPEFENSPDFIDEAIKKGYDVEIDLRILDDELYLGHDFPQYKIDIFWLYERRNSLWIHTKDYESIIKIIDTNLRFFFHEKESHTLISNTNLIWSHNLEEAGTKSVIPLLSKNDIKNYFSEPFDVFGVCTDYVLDFKK